ncbi:hypothetical protein SAMN05443549_104326 [Flavobacterium fluvii]|uniref:Uncharacterized protein n=1 Tax=Flavobacterium fluvii TaxID=468056 RepID=A0A1M5KI26_9FLAO|nr:hypothetical protein [Flavobacterium fluvii]SHG52462.1 hypothetical protein SAMN05443549_104326 [Flavobacterium fluvii]
MMCVNASGALTTSKYFLHFDKKGIIVPQITYEEFDDFVNANDVTDGKYYRYNQRNHIVEKEGFKILLWDKSLVFFSRKINDKFCFLHRIKPEIQVVTGIESLEDLSEEFWRNYLINFKD